MGKEEIIKSINALETQKVKVEIEILRLQKELGESYQEDLLEDFNKIVGKCYRRVTTNIKNSSFDNIEFFLPIKPISKIGESIKCICLEDDLDGCYGVKVAELNLWENNKYSKIILDYEEVSRESFNAMFNCYLADLEGENNYGISD